MLQKAKKNYSTLFCGSCYFQHIASKKDQFSHVKSIIVDDINNVNNNNNNNNNNDHDNE